jgi:hypothetical protein
MSLRSLQVLTNIDWTETGMQNVFDGYEGPLEGAERVLGALLRGCLCGEFNPANVVLQRFWERSRYLTLRPDAMKYTRHTRAATPSPKPETLRCPNRVRN